MLPFKSWAIQCKNFYIKNPKAIGWPYLTFQTQKAAIDWINQHKIEGVAVRVRITITEVV